MIDGTVEIASVNGRSVCRIELRNCGVKYVELSKHERKIHPVDEIAFKEKLTRYCSLQRGLFSKFGHR